MITAEMISADAEIDGELFRMTLDEYRASKELDREATLQVMDPKKRANLMRKQKRYPEIAERQRAYSRKYNAAHKSEKAAYQKKWRQEHAEQVKAYNAAWKASNKEHVSEYNRKYRIEHLAEIKERERKRNFSMQHD